MKYFIDNFRNLIDFSIRQRTKFSRKNYFAADENTDNLFESPALDREIELKNKYDISILKRNTTKYNYTENLYTLDILDKYLAVEPKASLNICDIGSKNWFYVKGEYAFFKSYCNALKISGVELDAHRLYLDFYSRYEVAKYNIKDLDGAEYIVDDFLNIREKYDYITWFLPFVNEYSHIKWGLPLNYFVPEKLILHAYDSLNQGGKILIVNQGIDEYTLQQELLQKSEISFLPVGEINSVFLGYKNARYALIINKN